MNKLINSWFQTINLGISTKKKEYIC